MQLATARWLVSIFGLTSVLLVILLIVGHVAPIQVVQQAPAQHNITATATQTAKVQPHHNVGDPVDCKVKDVIELVNGVHEECYYVGSGVSTVPIPISVVTPFTEMCTDTHNMLLATSEANGLSSRLYAPPHGCLSPTPTTDSGIGSMSGKILFSVLAPQIPSVPSLTTNGYIIDVTPQCSGRFDFMELWANVNLVQVLVACQANEGYLYYPIPIDNVSRVCGGENHGDMGYINPANAFDSTKINVQYGQCQGFDPITVDYVHILPPNA